MSNSIIHIPKKPPDYRSTHSADQFDPDDFNTTLEDLAIVETLCGEETMRIFCISVEEYLQCLDYDFHMPVCPECLASEELAMALLKHIL